MILDVVRERMEARVIVPRIRQKMAEYDLQWVGMERSGFQLSLIQFARRKGLAVKEALYTGAADTVAGVSMDAVYQQAMQEVGIQTE